MGGSDRGAGRRNSARLGNSCQPAAGSPAGSTVRGKHSSRTPRGRAFATGTSVCLAAHRFEAPADDRRSVPRQARPAGNPEDVIEIQHLKLGLADANASIARLQSRLDEDAVKIQELTVENKRLAASEADLAPSLATANQTLDVLQKELKNRSDHATQIEIAYQKLRELTHRRFTGEAGATARRSGYRRCAKSNSAGKRF